MIARIGHVFGWVGDILGGLLIVGGLAHYFRAYEWITTKFISMPKQVTDPAILKQLEGWSDEELLRQVAIIRKAEWAELETLFTFFAAGIVVFLIGRGLRYIFAGARRSTINELKQ